MYNMQVDNNKKIFSIEVGGFFKEDEGDKFIQDYTNHTTSFIPSEYSLLIVGKDLSTSKQEMLPILEQVLTLYKQTGFKKYYGILPESPTSKMQLARVIDKIGIDITPVNSINEIK